MPDDEDDKIILPPTYPLTTFKGRVHGFEHGEYRVSIELPPDTKRNKDERRDSQKPGYQIDHFPDGTNICEIDSIQSQSNRIEPQLKTIKDGKLVPQITVEVGAQTVNILDAGHRSAQYTPAADYVALGAIKKETAELKDKDDLRLSKEGGVHALSTQTVGGVALTATSKLVRTVNVNLAAIRQLSASGLKEEVANDATDEVKKAARKREADFATERTRLLREYILGLTLLAAHSHPSLNLREGCNLQITKQSEMGW